MLLACTYRVIDALGRASNNSSLLSCSPNFLHASKTRYSHTKHEPIVNYNNKLQRELTVLPLVVQPSIFCSTYGVDMYFLKIYFLHISDITDNHYLHKHAHTFLKTWALFDLSVFILSPICPWSSSEMAKRCLAFFSDSSSRDFHTP